MKVLIKEVENKKTLGRGGGKEQEKKEQTSAYKDNEIANCQSSISQGLVLIE